MGRSPRVDVAGGLYHALNRGNAKNPIFFKDEDYLAFERIVVQGLEKFPVDLFAYQWMNNHWHMVLSPQTDGGMGVFLSWVTLTHTQRYHAHHGTTGWGHVYQGRFRAFQFRMMTIFLLRAGTSSEMRKLPVWLSVPKTISGVAFTTGLAAIQRSA